MNKHKFQYWRMLHQSVTWGFCFVLWINLFVLKQQFLKIATLQSRQVLGRELEYQQRVSTLQLTWLVEFLSLCFASQDIFYGGRWRAVKNVKPKYLHTVSNKKQKATQWIENICRETVFCQILTLVATQQGPSTAS